jgi:hypothetical protein
MVEMRLRGNNECRRAGPALGIEEEMVSLGRGVEEVVGIPVDVVNDDDDEEYKEGGGNNG